MRLTFECFNLDKVNIISRTAEAAAADLGDRAQSSCKYNSSFSSPFR